MSTTVPDEAYYESKELRRSRGGYLIYSIAAYWTAVLTSDDFLAKLLHSIGMKDSTVGILSSLMMLTLLAQLAAVPLSRQIRSPKRAVTCLHVSSMVLSSVLYAVPFLHFGLGAKTTAVTVLVLAANILWYMSDPLNLAWANTMISPYRRGSFGASRDIVQLLSGTVIVLLVSRMVDRLEQRGRLSTAFLVIIGILLVTSIMDFCGFMVMKDQPITTDSRRYDLKDLWTHTMGCREFRNVVILVTGFDVARFMTIGFMGTYKIVDLGFSLSAAQVINVVACLLRALLSRPLGKYSDRRSFARGYLLGCLLLLACFTAGMLTTPSTRFLMVVFVILLQANYAGTSANTSNMLYCSVERDYVVPALVLANGIRGAAGFFASVIGGKILTAVQANGNMVCGIPLRGQQLLCAVSALITLAIILFNYRVVCRQRQRRN